MVQLGPLGAAAIGVASMVGAGVFYIWAPAAALAGSWIVVAVAIAGTIAVLNAVTMAQLAVWNPVSGGGYAYARTYVSPGVGFVSGFLFLAGKTASVGAISLIAARHLAQDHAPLVAAALIALFAAINISGVRTTAWLSLVIALIVVGTLVGVTSASGLGDATVWLGDDGSVGGVLEASALIFFAFAGYARMATMGAEVRSPQRVLPWVIVGTISAVVVLYSFVGGVVVSTLGIDALATSLTPVADIANEELAPFVAVVAVVASLGSLMTILAGLSRTALAMAQGRDLPAVLGRVWSKTTTPVFAEMTMAGIAIVIVVLFDPLWLVGASSGAVLTYYALAHVSALRQPGSERFVPRLFPVLGFLGCAVLVLALPLASLLTSAALILVSMLIWWGVVKPRKSLG